VEAINKINSKASMVYHCNLKYKIKRALIQTKTISSLYTYVLYIYVPSLYKTILLLEVFNCPAVSIVITSVLKNW